MNRSRRIDAFTLIELLVVIGLIAILSSLLLIGVGKMITNGKRQRTQLAFQNAQALFSEWDAVNHQHFSNGTIPCPQNVTADYYNATEQGTMVASGKPSADRGSLAVLMTRGMISQFKQSPAASTALGKLSASAYANIPFNLTAASSPPATPAISSMAFGSPPYNPNTVYYVPINNALGNTVNYYFVCVQSNSDPSTTNIAHFVPVGSQPSPAFPSGDTTDSTVPALVDGWSNPIIFVPGGVLGYPAGSTGGPGANNGMLTAGGLQGVQVRSTDGRPFWASAGPDGDFSAGDDNMYSFEK